jgi:hypothetical protein
MDATLSPPPATAASEVLDNDDLLGEILLRLAFPAALVRAALVCARWLRVVSGAAFLRRFRGLHPPPLVGFYAVLWRRHTSLKFVPMPNLPPELAAAAGSVGAALVNAQAEDISGGYLTGSRDGRLFVLVRGGFGRVVVLYPLHRPPRQAVAILAPRPVSISSDKVIDHMNEYTLGGGRGGADVCVTKASCSRWQFQRTAVDVHEHSGGGGAWRNLASMELEVPLSAASHLPFIDGRLYLVASASAVTAMRLAPRMPADVPTIALPDGLENKYDGSYKMVVASDRSGLHLARRVGFQVHVSHHRIGGDGADDGWSLVDTVCLRKVCAGLGLELPSLAAGDEDDVLVHALGDDAEFVFLQVGKDVLCVHVKSRVAEKVYTVDDERLLKLVPLVMPRPWPPIFPAVES